MSDSTRPLGRRPPTDDEHIQKYSLTLQTVPDKPTPVVLGLNWYQNFDSSRMMSLLNRKRYDAGWLYHEAQRIDEWPGEDYDGTSVRAGMDVLRTEGHRRKFGPLTLPPSLDAGIKENRWATNVVEVLACLHDDVNSDSVILCNSWGKFGYPHYVHLPLDALARLLREDGEATVVTDR
jgi:hypothetical protein